MKNLLCTMGLIALAALNALATCSEADKTALIKFDKDWTAANSSGDRNAIAAFYADEFMTFPNMIDKNAAINNAVSAAERSRANPQAATATATDHYQITCSVNTATVVHRNKTSPAGGGPVSYSRSVHFLEKRNGRWVAVSNAGGPLNDSDMLRYMELDWISAVRARDYDWMEKNFASDFTEVSPVTGDLANKRQAIDGFKADKTVFDAMEVSDMNIRVDGNTAIVVGKGYGRGKWADGKPFELTLRFTDTYIKRDGRWQAWASQATVIPSNRNAAGN
jgi:ketosteroid isomerase-like protein